MYGRAPQRLRCRQAAKPSSDYHNPGSVVNPVASYGTLDMIAIDSVFHGEKPYRSNVRVSIEPSTECKLPRQGQRSLLLSRQLYVFAMGFSIALFRVAIR
jgi:hypothetical protein